MKARIKPPSMLVDVDLEDDPYSNVYLTIEGVRVAVLDEQGRLLLPYLKQSDAAILRDKGIQIVSDEHDLYEIKIVTGFQNERK